MKKTMKKKKAAKKASIVAKGRGAKARVFKGLKTKTSSGLTKDTLIKSKSGKVVSKAHSAASKKKFASGPLKKWCDAAKVARKEMGIKGFCAVGGSTPEG